MIKIMAWLLQSTTDGTVIISDINVIFGPKQIRNMDLIGRRNAEASHHLKQLIADGTLHEVRKDPAEDAIDPKLVQQLQATVQASQATVQAQTQVIQTLQTSNEEAKKQNEEVKKQNDDLKVQNEEIKAQNQTILEEIQKFANQRPLDVKTYADAMRNILAEHGSVVTERAAPAHEHSDAEMKTHDRILKKKQEKLEKNLQNIGNTVAHPGADVKEAIDALDQLGL